MKVPVPDDIPAADALGRVHFVGIGGAGLSGIARIMLARGVVVSGSDARESRALTALTALGARVHVGHRAEQVAEADTLVVSTAVRADNPEVVEAQARGLRILPRSAALDSVMRERTVVAVAGTHGKTTTTSLLTVALQHCGADPSFAIGGELNESGSNAHDGSGDLFVAEADESDGAFLVYSPTAAIVTNVEADHLDNYGTEEAYRAAFVQFLDRIQPGGFLVACADDPGAADLAQVARERGLEVVTVGESAGGRPACRVAELPRLDLDLHRRPGGGAAGGDHPADPRSPLRPRRTGRPRHRAAARLRVRRPQEGPGVLLGHAAPHGAQG